MIDHRASIMHNSPLDSIEPYPWLRYIYQDTVVIQIRDEPEEYRDAPERFVRISFSELQRIHLRKLQCKLAQHAVKICLDDVQNAVEPAGWEDDLKTWESSAER